MKAIKAGLTRLEDRIEQLSLNALSRTQVETRRALSHDGKETVIKRKQAGASSRKRSSHRKERLCKRCSKIPLDPETLKKLTQTWHFEPEALDYGAMGPVFEINGLNPDVCALCWLIQET
jgi:hypothetical protein